MSVGLIWEEDDSYAIVPVSLLYTFDLTAKYDSKLGMALMEDSSEKRNIGSFVSSKSYDDKFEEEIASRMEAIVYEPGRFTMRHFLHGTGETLLHRSKKFKGNSAFRKKIDRTRESLVLTDVTGITTDDLGNVIGTTTFNEHTESTGKYFTSVLPFVSTSYDAYKKAIEFYGYEGPAPYTELDIIKKNKDRGDTTRRSLRGAGREWFGEEYTPRPKSASKSSKARKTREESELDRLNSSLRSGEISREVYFSNLKEYYKRNVQLLTLTDDQINAIMRLYPDLNVVTTKTLNHEWYKLRLSDPSTLTIGVNDTKAMKNLYAGLNKRLKSMK